MKTFEERRAEMDYGNDSSEYLTGWGDLLMQADAFIALVDPDYKIIQIKEKLGGLRYYYKLSITPTDEVRTALQEGVTTIEDISMDKCERCGCDSKRQSRLRGWITSIFDEFFEKLPKD